MHEIATVGILVHGDNHFIVRGPLPSREISLALTLHWSLIQIGATIPRELDRWRISSSELIGPAANTPQACPVARAGIGQGPVP
jgi:hypothetical protein